MNQPIGQKIRYGYYVALFALFIVEVISFHNADELTATSKIVTHTVETLRQVEGLDTDLLLAEGAARGLGLAPDPIAREAIKAAPILINQKLRILRGLTADNPSQVGRLDLLEAAMAQTLGTLQKVNDLEPASAGERQTRVLALLNQDRDRLLEIRRVVGEMSGEERRLLRERQVRAQNAVQSGSGAALLGILLSFVFVLAVSLFVSRGITKPLRALREGALRIGGGDFSRRVSVQTRDELGEVAAVFNQMASQIQERQQTLADETWLKTGLSRFAAVVQGQRDLTVVCQAVLEEMAVQVEARHSLFYLADNSQGEPRLRLQASYAVENPDSVLQPGQGLAGQCLRGKARILLDEAPPGYPRITSALGGAAPASIVVLPLVFEGEVRGVVELARFQRFTRLQLSLLDQVSPLLALVLNTVEAGLRTERLLQESKTIAASLHLHQTELREKNQELEAQTARLRESERLLQDQQEELRQSNEELARTNQELEQAGAEMEEKAVLLAGQKKALLEANREMEAARAALEDKALQLALTSKYKSEFLSNMSHELRTPLNSLLILSKILAENAGQNLTPKQVRYSETIHSSANDLLDLINDILDLSKIESGTVEIDPGEMRLQDLTGAAEASFRHLAENKGLDFQIETAPDLPPVIITDARRLQQVVTNLLANAFKFTARGRVTLKIAPAAGGWSPGHPTLDSAKTVVSFTVADTGIGIPPEKQALIFEAFQQAEAGTARKYGGTGLGLSISRELTRLLGGELRVESVPGEGSSFTLYLPDSISLATAQALGRPGTPPPASSPPPAADGRGRAGAAEARAAEAVAPDDDRNNIQDGDLVLLIVEDDPNFARVLIDFAREKKFKAVAAGDASSGLALARQLTPSAITLDLQLPDSDGWVVLDQLKHNPQTRHIPVHVISARSERARGLRLGAVSYLEKPVTREAIEHALSQTIQFLQRPVKNVLVVEDDPIQRQTIADLIGDSDVSAAQAGTAAEALAALGTGGFDCIVLDLGLPDMSGAQLIREIHRRHGEASPPVVVYTAKSLTREEESELRMLSESIILKDARSPERLLDETALFLHRVQSKLPESKQRLLDRARKADSVLAGRTVLVVDDDIRNIFAITSALESHGMKAVYAESGAAALEVLQNTAGLEAVLMDVMMPEMDGYEAIRRVRQLEAFKKIPIIAVTAKAMKGDREKCLEAGASDYITKPVDMDQLRSLLRVWLCQ